MSPILIASILSLFLTTVVQAVCPTGCDCLPDPLNPQLSLLVCRWSSTHSDKLHNLSHVRSVHIFCEDYSLPEDLLVSGNNLQQLKIEGCRVADATEFFKNLENLRSLEITEAGPSLSLKEGSFTPLVRLESLKVVKSGLQRLPTDIFCSLKNLQVLNVSENALASIKTEAGCSASQLIIADFARNQIDKIGDHLHLFPSVRQLSLAHNKLSSFPPTALTSVAHLQQLDLEDNQLDTVEGLPITLIHVNLAYNRLAVLPPSLAGLPSLVSLNLSHNGIDESSPSVLASPVLESLDLSWNRVRILPSRLLPVSVVSLIHLNLEGNLIADLKPLEFQNFTKLQTLNLASNSLKLLRDEVFTGVQHLSHLKLQNNSLDTVEPAVFADVAVDEMDLSQNSFTEAPIAIGRLYKLKKLDLSGNRISKLYQFIFNKIPHLHTIDLSRNELQSIGPFVFSDSAHLTTLNVSHNQVMAIFKDSFVKCPQLKRIDLSHNRIESIEEALSQASSVRRLDVSSNRLALLQWDSLPAKLETLIADNNQIALLGAAYNSRVRVASIKSNKISQLSADQVPASLEHLDLSGNKVQHIAPGTFGAKTAMKRLNLAGNSLETLARDGLEVLDAIHGMEVDLKENPLKCSCELDWVRKEEVRRRLTIAGIDQTFCLHALNKRKISLAEVTAGDLLCEYDQVCEPECPCCQYGNCDCKAVCPAGCACFRDADFGHNIVRCSGLNHTAMKAFSPSDVPMSATHVFLSGLSLPILRSHSFLGRARLQHLHINASRIHTIQSKAFNSLPNLKLLDLSDNSLETLTGDEFQKTAAISHLFLNGNGLTTVEKSLLEKLPSLQMITLHKNRMSNISRALSSSGIVSLSLSGNPFRCDCEKNHAAPHWIHANRGRVVDAERILCVENVTKAFRENDTTVLSAYPPNVGHDIFTMPMNEFLRDFNRSICVPLSHGFFGQEPNSSILFLAILIAGVLLLCAVIFLIISVGRRTHSALNQRRYKASSSLNCSSSPGSSPLPLPLISYDAFVSYSLPEEKMVMEKICRRLEDECDYHLCLLHRDGPKYSDGLHSISDELISQMDASQALILVLTKSFLEREWRTLQIKTSHQLFAKNRQKRLVAVFADNSIDMNTLDDELGQMLRKNAAFHMSNPLFWTLLKSALPARHSPPPSDSSQIYSDLYGIVPSAMV